MSRFFREMGKSSAPGEISVILLCVRQTLLFPSLSNQMIMTLPWPLHEFTTISWGTLTCVYLSDPNVWILKWIQLKHKLGRIHVCKYELRSYYFVKKKPKKLFLHNTWNLNKFSQEQNLGIVLHQGDSFYCLAVNHLLKDFIAVFDNSGS